MNSDKQILSNIIISATAIAAATAVAANAQPPVAPKNASSKTLIRRKAVKLVYPPGLPRAFRDPKVPLNDPETGEMRTLSQQLAADPIFRRNLARLLHRSENEVVWLFRKAKRKVLKEPLRILNSFVRPDGSFGEKWVTLRPGSVIHTIPYKGKEICINREGCGNYTPPKEKLDFGKYEEPSLALPPGNDTLPPSSQVLATVPSLETPFVTPAPRGSFLAIQPDLPSIPGIVSAAPLVGNTPEIALGGGSLPGFSALGFLPALFGIAIPHGKQSPAVLIKDIDLKVEPGTPYELHLGQTPPVVVPEANTMLFGWMALTALGVAQRRKQNKAITPVVKPPVLNNG